MLLSEPTGLSTSLYFPIRRFNPAALLLPDGSSLLDRLSQLANLIVIEDVDLTGDILKNHLRESALHHLAASDATNRIRMQLASLFCVTRKACSATLPGRRLW